MKCIPLLFISFVVYSSFGQIVNPNRVDKNININKDTIALESVAISPINFVVTDSLKNIIEPHQYYVNHQKAQFFFYNTATKKATVSYFKYPSFLTQNYSAFDKKIIIPKATASAKTYSLKQSYTKSDFFGALNTYGNITRGITVGNNQGSVLNAGLDLQITGNLSKKLKIRASIKDSNLPIQENGISQNINEFDRVFIELFTNTWNLKAGDVDLSNKDSYFLNFTKKVNGAKVDVDVKNGAQETYITASGALVRGKFRTQNITAQEGNQGPYQLFGVNGERNIVVISGSETIYINGATLKRGTQHDYTIDYNTSEITFNPTFPINASQRIIVDFQYSDQNYNRFITHNGVKYKDDKFTLHTFLYHENDVKSQSIQNLSNEQKLILQQAGNNPNLMFAESAQPTEYDQNRIQYIKTTIPSGQDIFVFSSNESDTLYNVTFSFVGNNKGDYVLKETVATGNVFEYIAPESGSKKGNYAPISQLFAPNKTQMAVIKAGYKVDEKSFVSTEIAYSNNDLNLFSSLDNQNNQGLATTLTWQQQISKGNWQSYNLFEGDFVQKTFRNIEGLYNVEFNRDWNIDINQNPNFLGNQTYLRNAFALEKNNTQKITFNSAYLNLGNTFKGFKNGLNTAISFKKFSLKSKSSYLNSQNQTEKGNFIRHQSSAKYHLQKAWLNGVLTYENNHQENKQTKALNFNNQKYLSAGMHVGVGDTTNVYTKIGYAFTAIDSVKTNVLTRVQNTQNYTLESQWIKNKQASFSTFGNYRKVNRVFSDDVEVVNARAVYTQHFFNRLLHWSTTYETSSASTPQQNFTYIEVEPGQGYYAYLGDLNNNNLKDFDEFEVAQFTDQAKYLRVVLPNISSVATQKAKLSQSVFLNFIQFKNSASKALKWLSHFSNQSGIVIDKDQLKTGKKFNINPFAKNSNDIIGLQKSINTNLYFNRGLQKYSTTYTYQTLQNKQNIASSVQTTKQEGHELNFQHNILNSWLVAIGGSAKKDISVSDNFSNRNFNIVSRTLNPNISFFKNEFSTFKTTYLFNSKINKSGNEALKSHDFGLSYNYSNPKKGTVLANFNLIENNYNGSLNTLVSYKILEGLQPSRNYTWSFILQKKLTQLLDLSITYDGRKSPETNTIHTGSIQLRANF